MSISELNWGEISIEQEQGVIRAILTAITENGDPFWDNEGHYLAATLFCELDEVAIGTVGEALNALESVEMHEEYSYRSWNIEHATDQWASDLVGSLDGVRISAIRRSEIAEREVSA